MRGLSWQQVALVAVLIVAVVVTLLVGPSVGLDPETVRLMASGEGTVGIVIAWLMRSPLSSAEPRVARGERDGGVES